MCLEIAMKKIPTLFDRDWTGDRSRVVATINPPCQWVIDGEGVATRKIDGACARVLGGVLYRRRELRQGEAAPAGFELADRDDETGKTVGWTRVGDGPEDRWFREAFARLESPADGAYELLGPKVQGNPEGLADHVLSPHDTAALAFAPQPPRDFEGLKAWMAGRDIEGVVWHHPDGRRAKLKLRDFGLKRG
ncbi:MAG: hypothetical protein JWR84_2141 [Caulobacter sp.]|nr:hypothetical protein [Caulobacter sp.]